MAYPISSGILNSTTIVPVPAYSSPPPKKKYTLAAFIGDATPAQKGQMSFCPNCNN